MIGQWCKLPLKRVGVCVFCRISYRVTYYINGTAVFVRYRRHATSSTSTSYCHDIWAISHSAAVWLRTFQTEAFSRETRSIRRKDCHSESCLSIRHSRTKGHCRCVDCSWLFVCLLLLFFVVLFFNYLWFPFYVSTSCSTRWFCTTYLRCLLLENLH